MPAISHGNHLDDAPERTHPLIALQFRCRITFMRLHGLTQQRLLKLVLLWNRDPAEAEEILQ